MINFAVPLMGFPFVRSSDTPSCGNSQAVPQKAIAVPTQNVVVWSQQKVSRPQSAPSRLTGPMIHGCLLLHIGVLYRKCKWGLYGDTVSILPVVFQGIDRQTQCLAQVPQHKENQSRFRCMPLKRW